MMGAPFVGRATLGYEPHTGKYVSTWIDSMSPVLFMLTRQAEGRHDHDSRASSGAA